MLPLEHSAILLTIGLENQFSVFYESGRFTQVVLHIEWLRGALPGNTVTCTCSYISVGRNVPIAGVLFHFLSRTRVFHH